MHEGVSVLPYTYIACFVSFSILVLYSITCITSRLTCQFLVAVIYVYMGGVYKHRL